MINDMMTTWISLQDHEVTSQSGPQMLCVWPLPRLVVPMKHVCLEVINTYHTGPCLAMTRALSRRALPGNDQGSITRALPGNDKASITQGITWQ